MLKTGPRCFVFLFFSLGCWIALSGQAAGQDDCPCGPSSRNGSFARLIPQEYHGADFRPACRAHDACYGCAGSDKEACDRQFLADLICACQNSDNPRRCEAWARRMYLATRVAGKRSFIRAQQ
jgi:hypothetical protein